MAHTRMSCIIFTSLHFDQWKLKHTQKMKIVIIEKKNNKKNKNKKINKKEISEWNGNRWWITFINK